MLLMGAPTRTFMPFAMLRAWNGSWCDYLQLCCAKNRKMNFVKRNEPFLGESGAIFYFWPKNKIWGGLERGFGFILIHLVHFLVYAVFRSKKNELYELICSKGIYGVDFRCALFGKKKMKQK